MIAPLSERFWQRVDKTDGCWTWLGNKDGHGYGRLWVGRPATHSGFVAAHRYSAMLHLGMFDRRLFVCHSCDTPSCVRPDHLFLGSPADNMRDMAAKGRGMEQRKSHCKHGHPFDEANTHLDSQGKRTCRACWRARTKAYRTSRGAA